jgi:hypothetical protein
MKLSRLKRIIKETIKQIREDDPFQVCLCECISYGTGTCVGKPLPNGECDCDCCLPDTKPKFPKKYRR